MRTDRIAERAEVLARFPADVRVGITDVMRRLVGATRQRIACAGQPAPRSA